VTSFLNTTGAHRKTRQAEEFPMKKYIKPSAKSVKQSSVLKGNT
jgi:hypothetical protein